MPTEKIKISIITPAHNEAGHIAECIESVLNQTYSNFEMIVADDASRDDTASIAEAYSASDERIKLIRMQENGGAATARNAALDASAGDFLLFLDADDWMLPGMLSDLVEKIANYDQVDMFRLKGRKVYSRGEYPAPGNDYESRLYSPEVLISENKMSGLMANLFVKSTVVENNNIRFSDGMVLLEDQEFTAKCMINSTHVLYYSKQNYMYYQHPASISKNFKSEHFPDILICAANVYQCAETRLDEEELKAYRIYAYQKAMQYLKSAFKDHEVTALDIRKDMQRFLERVEFEWNRNIRLQFFTLGVAIYKGFKAS
jgi:glycosyltransferase involved in cell wall biosynthesis